MQEIEDIAEQIEFQMSLRDHLLVSHCGGLLVYRPYWGGRRGFSRGVYAEVKHWNLVSSEDKRAAFVHCKSDIKGLRFALNKNDPSTLSVALKSEVRNQISKDNGVDAETSDSIINHVVSRIVSASALSGGVYKNVLKNVEANWEKIVKTAKIQILGGYLTGNANVDTKFTGTFIFSDESDFHKSFPLVESFLKKGIPRSNGWESQINKLFPEGLK